MDIARDIVPTVGTVLAALASLVGVVVAIDQFTLRARMRRIVTWTTELLDVEEDPQRVDALTLIRDRAAASMVASTLLPIRHVAEGVVWLAAGGFIVTMSFVRQEEVGQVVATVAAAFFASQMGVRRAIRMYVERERVKAEYLEGAKVVLPRTDMLAKIEGGTRSEFGWAALFIAGFLGLAFGIGWFIAGERSFWPVGVVIIGIVVLSGAIDGVRKLGRRARTIPTLAGQPKP